MLFGLWDNGNGGRCWYSGVRSTASRRRCSIILTGLNYGGGSCRRRRRRSIRTSRIGGRCHHYRQIGCDDVLAKPIDRSRLHRVLSRYLPGADTDKPSRADQIDAVVNRLAADFRADLPATLATLSEALAQGDFNTVRFTTHRVKGLAGSIGYPELTALAEPVEREVDAGRLDAARDRCALLMNAMQTLAEANGVTSA